ncbi:hypothetical protein HN018_09535 [Lichenicola cladoniae]|uniref:Uncharacterized protein n=1 Tax=Lichenicola cladoniae TaxID=1484109 RepID=A0A6M8HPN5_9PROT|nr:hypothetical protein [Lichenicola cladoniae]NPD66535.1 hypothetical protein [Acetobacteraceae bacterium]QKE90250.1 hypothetical protein HN018_09535 [Lichenicola cladoniae]
MAILSRAFCIGILLVGSAPARANDLDMLRDRLGLSIVTQNLSTRIVPTVARPDRPVTMRDLADADRQPCLHRVSDALSIYPPALVRSLVHTLALADMIHAWDIRIGGFHAPGLIAVSCEAADLNVAYEIASLHNSFAALVLMHAQPDWSEWEKFNPDGFRYGDETTYKHELQDPGASDGGSLLNRDGFATALGMTGRENDFESYAQRAFGHPADLVAALPGNTRMQGKLRLLMKTYQSLAPDIENRFTADGLAAAAH